MRVLFIIGCLEGESKRYRVDNYREYLSLAGLEPASVYEIDIPARLRWVYSFDVIVFFRAAYSPVLEQLLTEGRRRSTPLVFDVDDLVIDPGAVEHVKAIRTWPAGRHAEYVDGVRRYGATLERCDYVTVPTQYLADYIQRTTGKRTFVLRNGLNSTQMALSAQALANRPPSEYVTIGYFSGTDTHSADFAQVVEPLVRIMGDFPQTRLLIVGYLDVPEPLRVFGARVETMGRVDWRQLPTVIARADINLAPLETGNPYCESKSELKYYEAALVGVPTVASPTDAFRWAIRHGENGFLANTAAEWCDALAQLVGNSEQRSAVAEKARSHALSTYTPETMSLRALAMYQILARHRPPGR